MAQLDNYILALLPTRQSNPAWIPTAQIVQRLVDKGHTINHVKTIMRRLQALEAQHLVLCEPRGKAYFWQRKEGASGLAKGAMTFDEALALQILRRFSTHQLPEHVSGYLKGLFDAAATRLKSPQSEQEQHYAQWNRKIAVVSGHFQLQRPAVRKDVFYRITDALFMERLLSFRYQKAGDERPRRVVMPLGLVEAADGLLYLVARSRSSTSGNFYNQPNTYRLDRMSNPKVQDEGFGYPKDFTLDAYIREQRGMEFFPGETIKITLKITEAYVHHLLETPLAADQSLTLHKDGGATITATVIESRHFLAWLLARADFITVTAPRKLRETIRDRLSKALRLYE